MKGFTLVEVVIAVSILAVLSLLTQQSIQQAVKQKTKIQGNLERSSELRSAFKVIERDIQMAFHHRGVNDLVSNNNLNNPKNNNNNNNINSNISTPNPNVVGNTVFKGTKDRLDFTSLNNARIYEGSFESDQNEIGYYTAECRKLTKPDETSTCLWRRVSKIIDDDVTEGGVEVVLLENVSNLEFKYYNNQIQEWIEEWISDQTQDSRTASRFPDAVEILVETNVNDKQLSFGSVVPVRHPNNKNRAQTQTQSPVTGNTAPRPPAPSGS